MTKLSLLKTRRRHGTRDTRTRLCHHGNVRGSYSSTPVHHSANMGDKQPRCQSATGGDFQFLKEKTSSSLQLGVEGVAAMGGSQSWKHETL